MNLESKLSLMIAKLGREPDYATVDVRWLNNGEIERDLTIQLYDATPEQSRGLEDDDQIFFYISDISELPRLFHPSHEDFEIINITDIY